jgi:leucine dehydrogenase
MQIKEIPVEGYEKVVEAKDEESGLHGIIAVHDTTLGPALGGMRMWPYANRDEAMNDVLRLAKGMTYKSAVAHTGLGGGKSVIIGDPSAKTEKLFRAMGRFVDSLDGLYITAEDVNTTIADLENVAKETKYVTGLSREAGSSGNPSPYTAHGCLLGVLACLERVFGSNSLKGKKVGVIGVGAVGSVMAREMSKRGAKVFAHDMREEKVAVLVEEAGVEPASEEQLLTMELDVFAPCALGGGLNERTIPNLGAKIVAGSANNQLLVPEDGDRLRDRGILYAPDYVINAGGIINVGVELLPGGYNEDVALEKIKRIPDALHEVFDLADKEGISTAKAADLLAEHILKGGRSKKG